MAAAECTEPVSSVAGRQRGFALLIVLWTLVLIAFLVARLSGAGSAEIRIAGNLAVNAAAQAAADGAIFQAIFVLSDPQPQTRWALDGAPHDIRIGDSRVTLRLANEAARVNPNFASSAVIETLLRVLGSDPKTAADLAAAIAEWVGRPVTLPTETVAAEYRNPDGAYRPPRSPMESLDELARVRGMTPAVLGVLRPYLTLYGPGDPDPAAADPVVAAALAQLGQLTPAVGPPRQAEVITARIQAVAQGPGNALVNRTAVARIDPSLTNGYALLAWDPGRE